MSVIIGFSENLFHLTASFHLFTSKTRFANLFYSVHQLFVTDRIVYRFLQKKGLLRSPDFSYIRRSVFLVPSFFLLGSSDLLPFFLCFPPLSFSLFLFPSISTAIVSLWSRSYNVDYLDCLQCALHLECSRIRFVGKHQPHSNFQLHHYQERWE